MRKHLSVPAVSRELHFIAQNAAIVMDVIDNLADGPLFELTDAVNKKAAVDADRILRQLEREITESASAVLRVEWANTNRGDYWEPWARVFMPRGPKRRIASLGLVLGHSKMALRLVGWIWPRWGGLDGRQELTRVCAKKVGAVYLPYESRRYPGWTEDDGIIWFDEQLSLNTSLDNLRHNLHRRSRVFLKAARPVLEELADR
jgi:hypothetical protein